MIYFATDDARKPLLETYLGRNRGEALKGRMRQYTYAELFEARRLPRGGWIFSGAESLTEAELELLELIQMALSSAGLTVLNQARGALRRYELLSLLHAEGQNEFRAHRAGGPLEDVRYPVFVREADEHHGSLTPLLYDRAALRRAMFYLKLRGFSLAQLLVMEFCDTANEQGLYRKYSLFRIGDHYIPRYLHVGGDWQTKRRTSLSSDEVLAEEYAYLTTNPHLEQGRRVFEMARIDYGRMDYGMINGKMQVWEINLAPVIAGDLQRRGPLPADPRLRELMNRNNTYAHDGIRDAFASLDPGELAGDEIRIELPEETLNQARRERQAVAALQRRQAFISKLAAWPGLSAVGPLLRRTFGWASLPGSSR